MSEDQVFCPFCGKKYSSQNAFCGECGKPRGKLVSRASTASSPTMSGAKKPRARRKWLLWAIPTAVLIVGIVVVLLVIFLPKPKLSLSEPIALTTQTVPSTGGAIAIQDPGGPLDEMTLNVPAGSYPEDMRFTVSYQEIRSHRLDEISEPASPVISVDNSHAFADQNMTLTIPIQKTDDEFAMAFFYDQEREQLQGIPFTELTNDHITIATGHFSLVVVLKAAIIDLEEWIEESEADSGFRPGFDDFQMVNYGSYVEPGGHCAGQSLTAMVYYNNRTRSGWEVPLYGRFDNNGRDKTVGFQWDDAYAMRLCSYVQTQCDFSWRVRDLAQFDLYNYLAFVWAIKQTGNPQYISIGSAAGGHAMIVYRVTKSGLYVADPNRPGEVRKIEYAAGDLKPYESGATAAEALNDPTAYTKFDYCGDGSGSAFVNESVVIDGLSMLLDNKDPAPAGLFPADPRLSTNLRIGSETKRVPLADGMVLSTNNLMENLMADRAINVLADGAIGGGRVASYRGVERLRDQKTLDYGANEFGVYYFRQADDSEEFINFYRYKITLLGATTLSPSPESDITYAGFEIPFGVTMTDGPDQPVYTWDYGDGAPISTENAAAPHTYAAEGLYEGTVSVTAKSSPDIVLASASFSVIVEAEAPAGVTTTAVSSGPGGTTSPGGVSSGIPATSSYQTLLETGGGLSEVFLDYYPSSTPSEVGATSAIAVPAAGTVRITVDFASSMATGPRFWGDEMGYRSQAEIRVRDQNGDSIAYTLGANGYDTEFARVTLEVDVPSAQAISVQVAPQSVSAYDNKIPASDGDYYLYIAGQYRMRVEFKI